MADIEKERAAFEAWVKEKWIALGNTFAPHWFERSKAVPDMYYNNRLDDMWKGWIARALPPADAAEALRLAAALEGFGGEYKSVDEAAALLRRLAGG